MIATLPDCIRAFYDAFRTGDLSLCALAVAPNWENYPREPGQGSGVAAFEHTITLYRAAMSDLTLEFERAIADTSGIALRVCVSGIAQGGLTALVEAKQREAAGTAVTFFAHDIHTIVDGRITESRHLEDWPAIFGQCGITY